MGDHPSIGTDDGYEGEGDFALYLWEDDVEEPDRVIRSHSVDDLREQGERFAKGNRYNYAWLYRWNYTTSDDDILIEEITP